jgi:hypothetical protein
MIPHPSAPRRVCGAMSTETAPSHAGRPGRRLLDPPRPDLRRDTPTLGPDRTQNVRAGAARLAGCRGLSVRLVRAALHVTGAAGGLPALRRCGGATSGQPLAARPGRAVGAVLAGVCGVPCRCPEARAAGHRGAGEVIASGNRGPQESVCASA